MHDNSRQFPILNHEQQTSLLQENISQQMITYIHITYGLVVLSYFTAGLTWIIPLVMSYLKRDEARHTWLYSHFDWQIKTFWYTIFFGGIASVMMILGLGASFLGLILGNVTLIANSSFIGVLGVMMAVVVIIWNLYRIVRGWVALSNRKAVP